MSKCQLAPVVSKTCKHNPIIILLLDAVVVFKMLFSQTETLVGVKCIHLRSVTWLCAGSSLCLSCANTENLRQRSG